MSNYRQQFIRILEGHGKNVPFFPDLSDWYVAMHTVPGSPPRYAPGEMIPDEDEEFHHAYTSPLLPEKFNKWSYLDFYRHFDWGVPVHLYDWFEKEYDDVEVSEHLENGTRTVMMRSAEGSLQRRYQLAADGSWCPTEYPVKDISDLDIWLAMNARLRLKPRYQRIQEVLNALPGEVVLDLVLPRSPFGKLVHELIGFEQLTFFLFDEPERIEEFMSRQWELDRQLVTLAANAPEAKVVIMSDHSDENLISPPQYQQYCIPYYQKIAAELHQSGKYLSSHLDGDFKGYMPLLAQTGFDILDGCTPFPMTNYHVTELAECIKRTGQCAWCGVPSSLFCQELPDDAILRVGREILDAFSGSGKLIMNVGDIVSPLANVHQVIALGNLVKEYGAAE